MSSTQEAIRALARISIHEQMRGLTSVVGPDFMNQGSKIVDEHLPENPAEREATMHRPFTVDSVYATAILIDLAMQGDTRKSISNKEISNRCLLPMTYLPKVIEPLVRDEIIGTHRGRGGGMVLLRDPEGITLLDVMDSIQREYLVPEGGLNNDRSSTAIQLIEHGARSEFVAVLMHQTIASLVDAVRSYSPQESVQRTLFLGEPKIEAMLGLRVLAFLAQKNTKRWTNMSSIATVLQTHETQYLGSTVAPVLHRSGMIFSRSGRNGGIVLAKSADEISVQDVQRAFGGIHAFNLFMIDSTASLTGRTSPFFEVIFERFYNAASAYTNYLESKTIQDIIS